jgi:signal transduction histidine kinase
MNFGILLFIYSSLCFSLSFIKPLRSNTRVYILLAVPPVLQFLFYCPWLYEGVYRVVFSGALRGTMSFQAFYNLDDFLHSATSMVNYMYLLFGLGFMIYHYFKTPKLKYFRSYFLFIFSGYLTIILLFIIFLWWSPKRLISLTTAADSMHILPVSILIEGRMLAYYPYVMLISFVTLLFSLYRFNHLYFDLKNMRNIIVRSFDISNTGIRFFNHMVKNYAMAALIDAETLRSRMPEDPALLPYADRIINTSQDLLRTLNGIQSKISVASLNLSLSNVKEIMDGALALVNLETVTLKYRADEPPPYALLDLGHMKEVFVNILNNAIQAMGPDTRVLTVEIRRDKAWVDISISDTGEGIEKQNLHKIFIPFYSTKNRRDNWGLGLTYCYRIVMAHRGKLYVDSEPGRGTSVKILIPLIEEEQRFEVPGITAGETA